MAKRIVWAPQAVADRIQVLDYWYKRLGTKGYSAKLDEKFKETVQLLSRFPQLGRQFENRDERVFVKDMSPLLPTGPAVRWEYSINPEPVQYRG